jgi:hypothetical protein
VGAAIDGEDWSRREQSNNLSRQERPTLAVGSVVGSQQRLMAEDGEEARSRGRGGVEAD